MKETVNKVLNDFIAKPYQQIWEDYVEKSNMEAQLFNDRLEAVEIKSYDLK